LQVGLSPEAIRSVLGGQALRLVEREDPLDLGPAPGVESLSRDPLLERVFSYLISAVGQMFAGVDPKETLALAELACDVGDDATHAPTYQAIMSLLEARARYNPTGDGRPTRFAPGIHLIIVAAALARTPDVPLPEQAPGFSEDGAGSRHTRVARS
jgi:hypothetical protein